jgi:hypothetical protein
MTLRGQSDREDPHVAGGDGRARRIRAAQAAERARNEAIDWPYRRCRTCRAPIAGLSHKRYCSDACKMRAYRERAAGSS